VIQSSPTEEMFHGDGVMINRRKTTQDILQDEMLRERAAVLARAGEKLTAALETLGKIEDEISAALALWSRSGDDRNSAPASTAGDVRRRLLRAINDMIRTFNRQRELTKTRYYYLIVTREALGLIHHQRLAELYRIPPEKRCLPEP
jgi:hypothetical protein